MEIKYARQRPFFAACIRGGYVDRLKKTRWNFSHIFVILSWIELKCPCLRNHRSVSSRHFVAGNNVGPNEFFPSPLKTFEVRFIAVHRFLQFDKAMSQDELTALLGRMQREKFVNLAVAVP